jgi:hypothetical protein
MISTSAEAPVLLVGSNYSISGNRCHPRHSRDDPLGLYEIFRDLRLCIIYHSWRASESLWNLNLFLARFHRVSRIFMTIQNCYYSFNEPLSLLSFLCILSESPELPRVMEYKAMKHGKNIGTSTTKAGANPD